MKEEEKSAEEDWWRQDKVDAIGWGAAFIWGALVLLAGTTNFAANFNWWDGWGVFLTGAGIITLIETVFRLQIPSYRYKWVGSLIFGCILLAFGLGAWESAGWVWILVLFGIGVIILREAFVRKR